MSDLLDKTVFTFITVIVLICVLFGAFVKCGAIDGKAATKNAHEWNNDLKLGATAISCNPQDTDGDGYVSCAFKLEDGSVQTFECAGWSLLQHSGCRQPKLNLNLNRANRE